MSGNKKMICKIRRQLIVLDDLAAKCADRGMFNKVTELQNEYIILDKLINKLHRMRTTYKRFRIGDEVETVVPLYDYKELIPIGTKFIIKSFPPCTIPGKYQYFIFAQNKDVSLRAYVNEVKKV